ncbi:MAG: DUF6941 family protein [Rubrobacteraceae bacterium]|jgi:hypothetical protein
MTDTTASSLPDDFKVPAFFVADHAVVENGKVYVNGGFFNRIYQVAYPTQISIAVVSLVEVPYTELLQDHRFAVEMLDAEKKKLPAPVRIEGGFRLAPAPDSRVGEPTMMPLAISLDGLSLERAGDYWFVFFINDNEMASYHMRVEQVGVIQHPLQPPTPAGGSGGAQEE